MTDASPQTDPETARAPAAVATAAPPEFELKAPDPVPVVAPE